MKPLSGLVRLKSRRRPFAGSADVPSARRAKVPLSQDLLREKVFALCAQCGRDVRATGNKVIFSARTRDRNPMMRDSDYHLVDRWHVAGEQDGPVVRVTYDWTIRANKTIIDKLSFLLKPILRSNHNWTMKRGEESLKLELLRRRAQTSEELARIPPPPGPSLAYFIFRLTR